jgi:hypothetical protein
MASTQRRRRTRSSACRTRWAPTSSTDPIRPIPAPRARFLHHDRAGADHPGHRLSAYDRASLADHGDLPRSGPAGDAAGRAHRHGRRRRTGGASLVLSLERMRAIEELDTAGAPSPSRRAWCWRRCSRRRMQPTSSPARSGRAQAARRSAALLATNAGGDGRACATARRASSPWARSGARRRSVLDLTDEPAQGQHRLRSQAALHRRGRHARHHHRRGAETVPACRAARATGLPRRRRFSGSVEADGEANASFGATLSAFEVMWPEFYTLGTTALGRQQPLPAGHGIYVLLETLGTDQDADDARFETVFGRLIEDGLADDAVIATSEKQRNDLWAIRDCPGEFPKIYWPQIGFDISLPTATIGDFVAPCAQIAERSLARHPERRLRPPRRFEPASLGPSAARRGARI